LNFESLKQELPLELLPKKFQDAVEVTRYLGLQYLWIGSLCIMQDSTEDWLKESGLMGQMYLNAFINIARASGTPKGQGLFYERDTRFVEPCFVEYEPKGHHEGGLFTIFWDLFLFSNIDAVPLNGRAWVYQERMLSSRSIHFARQQIFWECHEKITCELFPDELPDSPFQIMSVTKLNSRILKRQRGMMQMEVNECGNFRKGYATWAQVVFTYTFTKLTVPTDKLIDISALAWYWQRLVGVETQYLARLWRSHLPTQLLWTSFGGVHASTRQPIYRAPTWSWASVDGPVKLPEAILCEEKSDILITVRDAKTDLLSTDPFGPVSGGEITICGRLAKIAVRSTLGNAIVLKNGEKKLKYIMMVDLDCYSPHKLRHIWTRTMKAVNGLRGYFESCTLCQCGKCQVSAITIKSWNAKSKD